MIETSEFNMARFQDELEDLINKYSLENESNTPDYILAMYISQSLKAFNDAINLRTRFYDNSEQQKYNQQILGDNPNDAISDITKIKSL